MSNTLTLGPRMDTQPELAAFATGVYELAHQNGFNAVLRGEAPWGSTPDRDMVATAASQMLLQQVLTAEEGPLAAMGERARQHSELLGELGPEGLRAHLYRNLFGLTDGVSGRMLWRPGADPDALQQALEIGGYIMNGPGPVVGFDGLRGIFDRKQRRVQSALKHIVFGDN